MQHIATKRFTGRIDLVAALPAAALALTLLLAAGSASATGQVGETAADFSLYDTDNNLVSLLDSHGEVRMLFMAGWG